MRNSLKDIFGMTIYFVEPVLCPGEWFKAYHMQEVQKQWIVQWGNVSIKMWLFCFCNGIAGECSRPNGLVGVGWPLHKGYIELHTAVQTCHFLGGRGGGGGFWVTRLIGRRGEAMG